MLEFEFLFLLFSSFMLTKGLKGVRMHETALLVLFRKEEMEEGKMIFL